MSKRSNRTRGGKSVNSGSRLKARSIAAFSGQGRKRGLPSTWVPPLPPLVFAAMDPANKSPIMILSENDLRCRSNSAATRGAAFSTYGYSADKWYWEVLSLSAVSAQGAGIGVAGTNINEYLGENAFNWGYFPSGAYWTGAVNRGTGTPYGTNSILGFALDAGPSGNLDVYVNNVLSFSVAHGLTGPIWAGVSDSSTGGISDFVMNFGQDSSFGGRQTAQNNPDENGIGDFYYAPPAGYWSMSRR